MTIVRPVALALLSSAAFAACAGSRGSEAEPRREVATVAVAVPREGDEVDEAPAADASIATVEDEPDDRDPTGDPLADELESRDAAVFGMFGLIDGGAVSGWGLSGRIGTGAGTGLSRSGRLGAATTQGSLDKLVIQRVVRGHASKIRQCYEKELAKDPKLEGKAVPKFTIAGDGRVVAASLTTSTGNAALDACVLGVIRSLRFPAFDGGVVVVSYPFVFKAAP